MATLSARLHPGAVLSGLFDRIRPLDLVDEVASHCPAHMRAAVVTSTESIRRIAALRTLRYPLRRLTGHAAGSTEPFTCLLAMDARSARYWQRVFFADDAREERLPSVAALRVRRVADELAPSADLSLWRLPWPIGPKREDASVPAFIPMWLATDRSFSDILRGDPHGRSSRKNDARRVACLGLTVRVTKAPAEVDRFHRELYAPYVRARFGDVAVWVSPRMMHHALRQGWLLLLERGSRTVGGALLERWGVEVRNLAFGVGVSNGLSPSSVLSACYVHAITFAVDHGLPRLSFGTVRPVLSDGVLRYKRKWGARFGRPTTRDQYLLRYADVPSVRAALTAAPLVVERQGRLGAIAGAASIDVAETPGLDEIRLLESGRPTPHP
jgi:hypothetical protein